VPAPVESTPVSPAVASVSDTARFLGVHPNTVLNLIRKGEIPATRVGRRLLIPLVWLDAVAAGHLPVEAA